MSVKIKIKNILYVKQLSFQINNLKILSKINLKINYGEIHVIMGKNGSGKSTLANIITRHPDYKKIAGVIQLNKINMLNMGTETCAQKGVFLSFQYPVEIPGISNLAFLKTVFNSINKINKRPYMDSFRFFNLIKKYMNFLKMSTKLLYRSVNEGFSGGEKKYNEILQMLLLKPKLSILDEIDSGLDIDSLKNISNGIISSNIKNNSIIIITHHQNLLNYIKPDFVHILSNGSFLYTGDQELPIYLEKQGYNINYLLKK